MTKIFCLFFTLLCSLAQAQHKVTFIVKEQTNMLHDSIFITGNFSNWDSTPNPAYLMKPRGEKEKFITLRLPSGIIRYKFHRGSWLKVEKQSDGMETFDRTITIRNDTVLTDNIVSWRDQFFTDKWSALSTQLPDTTRVRILSSLAKAYSFIADYYNSDSGFYYTQQALRMVQTMNNTHLSGQVFKQGNNTELIGLQETTAGLLHSLGNYPKALEIRLENLKLAEKSKDGFILAWILSTITTDYQSMKDYPSMLKYARQQDSVLARLDTSDKRYRASRFWAKNNVAVAYLRLNMLPSALSYAKEALKLADGNVIDLSDVAGHSLLAGIYSSMNQNDSALARYKFVITIAPSWAGNTIATARVGMARVFQKTGRIDSALLVTRQALDYFQNNKSTVQAWGENSLYYVAEISPLLAELYQDKHQLDSAYKYLQLSIAVKDSLYNTEKVRQFQTLGFNETNRQQQLEQQSREEKQRYETRLKMYGLVGIIVGFVVLAFVLYRNNRQKQQANLLLQSQKQEIETTFSELKNTQKQLIQSEKMASLGEMTAGIAHEIQNPLNFVNNFSDVSTELVDEMNSEIEVGNFEGAKQLALNLKDNLVKINHHGKRAGDIVKGMLQHSRTGSGQKELTDINALCDEYLRLAYHGLKAKDKSFNAKFETILDAGLPKMNVVPQDIGRVILNLINNAFYAVNEKQKSGIAEYEPTVRVHTKRLSDKIEIRVIDNGAGIPQNVVDKIFQPFFTTKPTGEGTGLGLSLSYDIIVKGHGGKLNVQTKKDGGTEFIIII